MTPIRELPTDEQAKAAADIEAFFLAGYDQNRQSAIVPKRKCS